MVTSVSLVEGFAPVGGTYAENSKLQLYSWMRRPHTTRERRWCHAWDNEDDAALIEKGTSAPLIRVRAARTARHLPNEWDDEFRHVERSWKTQTKRRRQWKPKTDNWKRASVPQVMEKDAQEQFQTKG